MKIKQKKASWQKLSSLGKIPHLKPARPMFLLSLVIYLLSIPDLLSARFSYTDSRGDRAGKGPYFILMNHSSFLDLKMANRILFPHKYAIVSTTDAFVGKSLLMRLIGCIPTQKFVTDVSLVMNMIRLIKKRKTSILMYPEAGYSFDGTATVLPRKLGGMVKRLGVPVLLIRSDAGAFLRDPLYNGLRLRKVKAGADISCLLTPEEIREKSVEELDEIIDRAFSFDHFRAQKEEGILVKEKTRALGLERVLYRCPHCERDGVMKSDGENLFCTLCGASYHLKEDGSLFRAEGEGKFTHIPDWNAWQRACVKKDLEEGKYLLETPVSVGVICDHKAMYMVGDGVLRHDKSGFTLTSDDSSFTYTQAPQSSYSLNVDFFFYEIGDMISIGTKDRLFYLFPKENVPVAKARLAAEELYQMLL